MKPEAFSPPKRRAMLAFGLLAGLSAGAGEVCWRLELADGDLLAYALFWYGILGALYFGLAGEIARLSMDRGWYVSTYSARPAIAGGLVALGLPVLVIFRLVHLFAGQLPLTRLLLFFIAIGASGLTGWCLARALAARPGVWPARLVRWLWRPRWVASLLGIGLAFSGWKVLWQAPDSGVVRAAEVEQPRLIWIRVRGLTYGAGLGRPGSLTPELDRLAARGVAFSHTSERAWPSIPWPWPFSYLEPWLRPAAHSDPEQVNMDLTQLAERLGELGFRCRQVGAEHEFGFAHAFQGRGHDQRERQRSLLLSHLLGRALGALDFAAGSRAAPALETCFPFLAASDDNWDLTQRVRRWGWPSKQVREFLCISVDASEMGSSAVDQELGHLLDELDAEALLQDSLLVVSAWTEPGRVGLPLRVPLIVSAPGMEAGRQISLPISVLELPAAALEILGLGGDIAANSAQSQLYQLLVGH